MTKLIEMTDIRKVFYADEVETHALAGIHLNIDKGEYLAISGPSGCGKSTLLSLIGLLDTPTDGHYTLNGVAVDDIGASQRAKIRNKEIGFIFQAFNLIGDLNVLENVELPLTYRDGVSKAERRDRAKAALERVGMAHRVRHFPSQLSGGQQQRVAVARALVGQPSVLLADEPTGNLDSKNGEAVMAMLAELHAGGATICMVTHDPRYADFAERQVFMFDGQIVDEETLSKLRQGRRAASGRADQQAGGRDAMRSLTRRRVDERSTRRFAMRCARIVAPQGHDIPHPRIVAAHAGMLGVGVNAGIFSIFHQVLLQKLPIAQPDEMYALASPGPRQGANSTDGTGRAAFVFSYSMWQDLKAINGVKAPHDGLAGFRNFGANLGFEGQTSSASGSFVTPNYFDVLGLAPTLGRLFQPGEYTEAGEGAVVVLAHDYWQREFGADRGVIGRTLVVNGRSLEIIGVAAREFVGVNRFSPADVFVPITMVTELTERSWQLEPRNSYWIYLLMRLPAGTSPERVVSVTGTALSRHRARVRCAVARRGE